MSTEIIEYGRNTDFIIIDRILLYFTIIQGVVILCLLYFNLKIDSVNDSLKEDIKKVNDSLKEDNKKVNDSLKEDIKKVNDSLKKMCNESIRECKDELHFNITQIYKICKDNELHINDIDYRYKIDINNAIKKTV